MPIARLARMTFTFATIPVVDSVTVGLAALPAVLAWQVGARPGAGRLAVARTAR